MITRRRMLNNRFGYNKIEIYKLYIFFPKIKNGKINFFSHIYILRLCNSAIRLGRSISCSYSWHFEKSIFSYREILKNKGIFKNKLKQKEQSFATHISNLRKLGLLK